MIKKSIIIQSTIDEDGETRISGKNLTLKDIDNLKNALKRNGATLVAISVRSNEK